MITNKLTKTLALPIATGAAAIGVLAGSVLTATSASAVTLSWADFKAGGVLTEGDKEVTYVGDTFAAGAVPTNTFVSLLLNGSEYSVSLQVVGGSISAPGSYTYTIGITDPLLQFSGVALDVDTVGLSTDPNVDSIEVEKSFAEFSTTLFSDDGWPVPGGGGFIPVPDGLTLLTVTDTITPLISTAGVTSLTNKFLQEPKSVPEPGTILGLLAVGGLGLVSRFNRQK